MNQRPDAAVAQVPHQLVAPGSADDIQVVDMPAVLALNGLVYARQVCVINRCDRPTPFVELVQMRQLHAQDRRLQLVQAAVGAARLMSIAADLPVVAQLAQFFRQRVIIGDHRAAIAIRAHIFGRIKAERAQLADRPDLALPIQRAVSLGAIFNQQQIVSLRQSQQRIHIRSPAIQMHSDNRACAPGDGCARRIGAQGESLGFDISQYGRSASRFDSGHGGQRRMRHGDDFVARADSARPQRQLDGIGAGGDADCVADAVIRRELALECFYLGTEDVPATIGGAQQGGIDFLSEQVVQRLELVEWDHALCLFISWIRVQAQTSKSEIWRNRKTEFRRTGPGCQLCEKSMPR